ncbi:MAG: DciA family protein [Pseudomonadota bacterium]
MSTKPITSGARRSKGFKRTATLLQPRIKSVGSTRGFAVARLLTHWAEIVGADIARAARPVDVKYGKAGLGATLTLLVKGAEAPMIEMQKDRIRDTVNACYGYSAIQKVRLTQTAASGFAEPAQARAPAQPDPSAEALAKASQTAADVENTELRQALEALGARVLTQQKLK